MIQIARFSSPKIAVAQTVMNEMPISFVSAPEFHFTLRQLQGQNDKHRPACRQNGGANDALALSVLFVGQRLARLVIV